MMKISRSNSIPPFVLRRIPPFRLVSLLLLLLQLLMLTPCVDAMRVVKAWGAGNIEFENPMDRVHGRLEFIHDLSWRYVLYNTDTFKVIEDEELTLTERDEWSMYFCASSRRHLSDLDADLETNTVTIHFFDSIEKYNIVDVAPGIIHGYTLGSVVFGCHQLLQLGGDEKEWALIDPETEEEAFLNEYDRDAWSVYLWDNDLLRVQIDYHRKKVITSWVGNKTDKEEINITGADYSREWMNYFKTRSDDQIPEHVKKCHYSPENL